MVMGTIADTFEMSVQIAELLEWLEEEPAEQEEIINALNDLGDDLKTNFDAIAYVVTSLDGSGALAKAESKRLAGRAMMFEKNSQNLKNALMQCMKMIGNEKVKTPFHTIYIQKNPAAVVMDEQYIENIPEEFLIEQDPKIDKKAIAEAIKAGRDLEGIAHLEQSEGLRIR